MGIAVVTGASGLVGSAVVRNLSSAGMDVVGIDNDTRGQCFGSEGSTSSTTQQLRASVYRYEHTNLDVRDDEGMRNIFRRHGKEVQAVVHCAAQPSHDWAASDPQFDFSVNAISVIQILEHTRRFSPDSAFVFMSTNKVYGDRPNTLPIVEQEVRWEVEGNHPYYQAGIDELLGVDQCLHSVFGASKLAADIMVQEYGRYFGLKTVVLRAGCITGGAQAAVELHGFLGYLVRCAMTEKTYEVYGHKGKQVRDNLHAADLARAIEAVIANPVGGEVYNIGGGRGSSCSVLEAITEVERRISGEMKTKYNDTNRRGDHIWWITDSTKFQKAYPQWKREIDLGAIFDELVAANRAAIA